jgi:hypothetical protein
MLTTEHIKKGLERTTRENSPFYNSHEIEIRKILEEICNYFDEFANPSSETPFAHRSIRHHQEGIEEITRKLSKKYSPDFYDFIRREAEEHVLSDTYRTIPRKLDYEDPNFLIKLEANNTTSNWL